MIREIENAIRRIDGFGDEFRIVITREKTMDELIVQAEPMPGTSNESTLKLAEMLEVDLKTKGLRTLVQMQPPGTLERTEFKARRVIDQRDLYDEMTKG